MFNKSFFKNHEIYLVTYIRARPNKTSYAKICPKLLIKTITQCES